MKKIVETITSKIFVYLSDDQNDNKGDNTRAVCVCVCVCFSRASLTDTGMIFFFLYM